MNYITNQMKAIIIDDESANRNVLANMLNDHCRNIEVTGFAESADDGYRLISETRPDLVFLDIKMPGKSGFDMLRMFEKINFNVIFVSGFDQYAVQAFEFSAVDYILKPIDYSKLISAVNRAEEQIAQKNNNHIIHFIHSLDEKTQLLRTISLHQNDKVHLIDIREISYIQAIRGYSEIVTVKGGKYISAKTLTDYEELFGPYSDFLRVNKSIIINVNEIGNYTKGSICYITMRNNGPEIEVSRRKKTEIMHFLKKRP